MCSCYSRLDTMIVIHSHVNEIGVTIVSAFAVCAEDRGIKAFSYRLGSILIQSKVNEVYKIALTTYSTEGTAFVGFFVVMTAPFLSHISAPPVASNMLLHKYSVYTGIRLLVSLGHIRTYSTSTRPSPTSLKLVARTVHELKSTVFVLRLFLAFCTKNRKTTEKIIYLFLFSQHFQTIH